MGFVAGIVCDTCGAQMAFRYIGKTYIAKWSRERGWSVSRKDGKDICRCPKCRNEKRQEVQP